MGLMGAGGAIIAVPIFATVLQHAPKQAMLESVAVTGLVAATGAARRAWSGDVDWTRAGQFAGAGLLGTQLAAPLAVRMPEVAQVLLFAALASAAAWRLLASRESGSDRFDGSARTRSTRASLLAGLAIGALTSLLGVGGGFLLIPAFVVLEHMPMRTAVPTSLMVITANAAAGLGAHAWAGTFAQTGFEARAVAIVAGCGVVGSLAGSALASRIRPGVLRRGFAALLLVVTLLMTWKCLAE